MMDNESFEPTLGPNKRKRSSILKPPEKRTSRDLAATRTVSFNERCVYKELHRDGTSDLTHFFLAEDMDLTMMDIVEPDPCEPHNQTICSSVDMSMDQTTYGVQDIDVTLIPEQTIEQSLNESAMIDERSRVIQVAQPIAAGARENHNDVDDHANENDDEDDPHNTTLKPTAAIDDTLEQEEPVSSTNTAAAAATSNEATSELQQHKQLQHQQPSPPPQHPEQLCKQETQLPSSSPQQQHQQQQQQSPPPTPTMTINETTTKLDETLTAHNNTQNHTMMNTMMTTMMTQMSDISSLNVSNITSQTANETLYGAFHDSNNLSMQSSRTSGVDTLMHNIEALNECIQKVDQESEEHRKKLDQEIEDLLQFYRHIVNKNDKYEFAIEIFGLRYNLWLIIKVNPETYPNEKLSLKFAVNKKDRHMYPFAEYAESVRRTTKEGSYGYLTRFVINAQRFRRFLRKIGYGKAAK